MRLWLAVPAGILIFTLGFVAEGVFPIVNLLWLVYVLVLVALISLWVMRLNKKFESILSGSPDPGLIRMPFRLNVREFNQVDLNLSRVYGILEAKEFELMDQKERQAGENLNLILSATTDSLTGVPNKKQLEAHLKRVFGNTSPLSVVMVDIDHFKSVNDTYGHDVGDIVLKQFASTVKGGVRPSDHVFRYGGEEFILICSAGINETMEIAERVRVKVEKTPVAIYGNLSITITASFGVAEYRSGDTPESLIKRADKALYVAKQSGRNRVCKEA